MWILGGLLLGCCILGKYTAALAIPSGLATFWFVKSWRRCVWGYAIHIGVAFVTSLPILIYNIQEDFQPLLFQWRHATDNEPWSLRPVGEFVGVQILAAGAIPFLVFGWSLWQYRRLAQEPRLRVCLCLFVVPFAFFCYRGIRMRMEANWTLISYIAIWPLLAAWYDTVKFSFRWRVAAIAAFVPPVAITLFLSAHIVHPIPVASARVDRISRQTGREAVFTEVAAYWRALEHPAPVFVHRYQCASMLRFKGVEAYPLHGHRHNHFTKTGKRYQDQERFFVLAEGPLTPEEAGGMTFTEVAHTPLYVRGEKLSVITLYAYSRP
jgi:hypothetical protein